jgi:hypothetical protein
MRGSLHSKRAFLKRSAVLLSVPGSAMPRLTVRQSRSISKAVRWAEQQPAECVDPASQSEEP